MSNFSTRLAAAAVSGALVLSGGAVLPLTVAAQSANEPGQMFAPAQVTGVVPEAGMISTVDLDADVSLTINKRLGNPGGTTEPLGAVSFLIERVTLMNPLDTAAGWAEASAITADTAPVGEWSTTVTTDSTGSYTISTDNTLGQFTAGLYRVTEIQSQGYTVAAPFLITLPHTTGSGWSYDRTVEPKNQQILPGVSVSDREVTLGEDLRYTLVAPVPPGSLTRFNLVDVLAPQLSYNGTPVVSAPGVDLVAGRDYEIIIDGQTVRVNFLPPGLTALQAARIANPELAVQFSFDATVNDLHPSGEIPNNFSLELPNGAVVNTTPTDPNNPSAPNSGTITRLSTLTITKQGEGFDEPQTMEGATFELWRCTEDGDNWELVSGPITASSDRRTPTPATSFTTPAGADNRSSVVLYGVQAFNWVDNGPVDEDYCVVETAAPAGFSLNPEPQHVTFLTANPADSSFRMVATVTNHRNSILGQLPATGGLGVAAILLAGLALIGGGIWSARRSGRTAA